MKGPNIKNIYGISLVSILIISLIIVLTQSDAIVNTQEYIYKNPSYLNIREVDVRPIEVTSSFADINITAYISHSGGKTNNASMLIRAIDSNTGLLNSQESSHIPDIGLEKTLIVSQDIKIERNGNYDLKILLFDNGTISDSGTVNIRGINILTPQSKKSGIIANNIDFFVGGTSAGKVDIKPEIYIENTGPEVSENLKLIVKAREADSNLLADRITTETGSIKSEKTAIIKEVQLRVPDEYNYMIIVELWKDDALINTWEKPVLLAPTKTVPKGNQEKKINIEVSKFVRESNQGIVPVSGVTPATTYAPIPTPGIPKEPGFEIIGAIIVLLAALLYIRRS